MIKLLFVAMALVVACEGDEAEEPSRLSPCEQLREHMIDLRLADAMRVDKDAHREALRGALGASFIVGCEKLSDESLACALAAPDSASAAACDRGVAR